jgi:hypothetical protein
MKTFLQTCAIVALLLGTVSRMPAVQVTFQVNMTSQTALGNFDPAIDSVVVAGDAINSWSTAASPLTASAADTNIWEGTFDISGAAGSTVQYKYVMNTSASGLVWEGNVGSGSGNGNRTFVLPATNEILPTVYFNNVTNSSSVTNAITFQLNMSVQTALGNFDPSSGTVYIAGDFNAWNATATPLTNSVTDTNIWSATLVLSGALGSAVQYKYIEGGAWEANNVGPAGAQNRSVTLAKTNQILPAVYFNNLSSIPVPIPLVFQVNLAAQIALGNFSPASDVVEARGSFNNWSAGFALTNSSQDPTVYSGTFVDSTDLAGNSIAYQFVLNATTWETAVGNRMYTLTSTNEQSVPLVFFNDVNKLGLISLHLAGNGQANLGWTAGPMVRLQSAANLAGGPWQDVPNTQGSNSVTVTVGPDRKFFRLTGP